MKKEISISLLALSLAACGGDSGSNANEGENSSKITISSYSSAEATDTSPVGTWIAVRSNIHFTDDVQDYTFQSRELFTINEQGDNYLINSCDGFISRSSVAKDAFLTDDIEDSESDNYSEKSKQTFTSNINFTGNSVYTEKVTGEGNEADSEQKWIKTTEAIKISDTTDLQENISITSQNTDLSHDKIDIKCANFREGTDGLSTVNINSPDNLSFTLENGATDEDHGIYFESENLTFEAFKDDDENDVIDISYEITNNTVDNYSVTAIYSEPSRSATFNVSVDFK